MTMKNVFRPRRRLWLVAARRLTLLLLLGALMGASITAAQTPLADGQVVKIDQAAGKITIKHGPLKQFGMDEGMTMVYRAADPAMLGALKPGDKIKFAPDRVDGQFTATTIEKAR
jgi:Cu(I)/Ag(I) efflux system periplasmic protein CusF